MITVVCIEKETYLETIYFCETTEECIKAMDMLNVTTDGLYPPGTWTNETIEDARNDRLVDVIPF